MQQSIKPKLSIANHLQLRPQIALTDITFLSSQNFSSSYSPDPKHTKQDKFSAMMPILHTSPTIIRQASKVPTDACQLLQTKSKIQQEGITPSQLNFTTVAVLVQISHFLSTGKKSRGNITDGDIAGWI